MSKLLFFLVSLLLAASFLLAACGPAPAQAPVPDAQPSGPLKFGDPIWDKTVKAVEGDWIYIDFGQAENWYNVETTEWMRVCVEGECDDFLRAFNAELRWKGMEPTARATTWHGKPAVITPNVGVPINWAIEQGLISKADVPALVDRYYAEARLMYDELHIAVTDPGTFQGTWNPKTGELFSVDLGRVKFGDTPGFPDRDSFFAMLNERKLEELDLLLNDVEVFTLTTSRELVVDYARYTPDFYPTDLSQGVLRGYRLQPIDGTWWCQKGCDGTSDILTVKMENGRIWWDRFQVDLKYRPPMIVQDITYPASSVDDMAAAFRIQARLIGMDPAEIQLGYQHITVPDLGPDMETFLSKFGTVSRVQAAKADAKSLLMELYRNGVGVLDIKDTNMANYFGKVAQVDFEHVKIDPDAIARGYPKFSQYPLRSASEYATYVDQQLGLAFDAWKESGALPIRPADDPDGLLIAPTPGVFLPPAQSGGVPSSNGSIQMLIQDFKGETYPIWATAEERAIINAGGDDAVRLLMAKGIPMPPPSLGMKILAGIGEGLNYAGYVATVWIVSHEFIEFVGLGEQFQLGNGWIDNEGMELFDKSLLEHNLITIPYDPGQGRDNWLWLITNGYDRSPALGAYFDNRHISDTHAKLRTGLQQYRLDNNGITDLPTMNDYDTVTPIVASSPREGVVVYTNIVSGEQIVWEHQGLMSWVRTAGNECMRFYASVNKTDGGSVLVPFEFCADSTGTRIIPVWWRQ